MPRQVSEITIQTPSFSLCVMTTHLEYGSQNQRYEQVKRILSLKDDIDNLSINPATIQEDSPYAKLERSNRIIICGDFNFEANSEEYSLISSYSDEPLIDSWTLLNSDLKHAPTCGIYDKKQWSEGPHCRDFAFISDNLKSNIANFIVNEETDASDHQPIVLTVTD